MSTYQSVQTTTWATSGSVVVTKPTSLAVGDFMYGIVAYMAGSSTNWNTPSGWTAYANTTTTIGSSEGRLAIFTKVADSADVAASNFTFSVGSGTPRVTGAILRITNYGITDQTAVTTVSNNNTTLSCTGVTPIRASELYIIGILGGEDTGNDPLYSGYSFATSNPSWTEIFELSDGSSVATFTCAVANRTESTATGTLSITVGNGPSANSDHIVRLTSIAPLLSATSTPDPIAISTNVPVLLSPASAAFSVPSASYTSVENTVWTNPDKPSTTWNNPTK